MRRIHYAWAICAAGTLLLFVSSGLMVNTFSVYSPYIIEHWGFTNTQASFLTTVRNLVALGATFAADRYYRKLDIRAGAALALGVGALSFLCFALADGYAMFCVAAALAGFTYSIGGLLPVSVAINRWFEDRRALAVGICTTGSGIATIAMPPLLTLLIEGTSIRTAFFIEAAAILAVAAAQYLLLCNGPALRGAEPFRDGSGHHLEPGKTAYTGDVLTRKYHILMAAALFMLGATANSGFVHLPVLYAGEGFDSMTVALAMSVVGAALIIGKLMFGYTADRLGAYRTNRLFFSLLLAGQALTCMAGLGRSYIMFAAMALLGLGLSVTTVGVSVWAAELTGGGRLAVTVKRFQTAYLLGGLAFSAVPGAFADALGSYVPAYVLYTGFALLTALFVQDAFRHRLGRKKDRGK